MVRLWKKKSNCTDSEKPVEVTSGGLQLDTDFSLERLFETVTTTPISNGLTQESEELDTGTELSSSQANHVFTHLCTNSQGGDREVHVENSAHFKKHKDKSSNSLHAFQHQKSTDIPTSNDVISSCRHQEGSAITENSFHPLTMELRPDTVSEFLSAAEENSAGKFSSKEPFCLVGLHTCGDLGSTALRLFVQIPTAKALCVVPCCYHHITERGIGEEEGKCVTLICINGI